MILWTITPDQSITIILWILGVGMTILITIAVHIGNAGSDIKKDISSLKEVHGQRITRVETAVEGLAATGHRIEDKVDELLMKRK